MIPIVQKMIDELEAQLKDKKITIKVSLAAKKYLAQEGYSTDLGARVMRRVIQEKIKTPLSDEILFGKLKKGGTVSIDYKKSELTFRYGH
jgi:ATP-dependent Clp protease ATP-binding subunit ClpA